MEKKDIVIHKTLDGKASVALYIAVMAQCGLPKINLPGFSPHPGKTSVHILPTY